MVSFQYTDQHLNNFNKGHMVYSVNSNFVSRNNTIKIIPYDSNQKGKYILQTPDGQQFKVLATKVDKATGFDGMAVAPMIDGKVDITNVAVIAAATDFGFSTDGQRKDTFGAVIASFPNSPSPQEPVVSKWIGDLKKQYTIAQLSGYSQSAYMLKVGAHH